MVPGAFLDFSSFRDLANTYESRSGEKENRACCISSQMRKKSFIYNLICFFFLLRILVNGARVLKYISRRTPFNKVPTDSNFYLACSRQNRVIFSENYSSDFLHY